MEKKNTGLIVLVVVLSLLVVGLGGYIVYDKMLDKNINDSDNKGKNDNNFYQIKLLLYQISKLKINRYIIFSF